MPARYKDRSLSVYVLASLALLAVVVGYARSEPVHIVVADHEATAIRGAACGFRNPVSWIDYCATGPFGCGQSKIADYEVLGGNQFFTGALCRAGYNCQYPEFFDMDCLGNPL